MLSLGLQAGPASCGSRRVAPYAETHDGLSLWGGEFSSCHLSVL